LTVYEIHAISRVAGYTDLTGTFERLRPLHNVPFCPISASVSNFNPLPQDDPQQRQPDISLARERLEWQPEKRLKEGLKRTIGYFGNNPNSWL